MALSVRLSAAANLFIAICVGITVTGASPSLDPHLLELKQHYEHLSYIAAFPCRTPQPRVISVHKLFSQSELQDKAYYPDVTVLHRCDESSGCCTSGQHCAALHEDTVSLPFKITFLEDIEHHRKGSWLMEYHDFQNHTECVCSDHSVSSPISSQTTEVAPQPTVQVDFSVDW